MDRPPAGAVAERISRLKRKSRRLAVGLVAATVVLAGIVALDLLAFAALVIVRHSVLDRRPVTALSSFVFRDRDGKDRLFIGVGPDNRPGLAFRDPAGRRRLLIGLETDGTPLVELLDQAAMIRSRISLTEDGQAGHFLLDAQGNVRYGAALLDDGSVAQSFRDDKKIRLGITVSKGSGAMLALFDRSGQGRVTLAVKPGGEAEVLARDGRGKPALQLPGP